MADGKKVTPPLTSKGMFEVQSPFVIKRSMVYEVVAVRELTDLWVEGIDVYERYYKPVGIEKTKYQKDVDNDVAIVSLLSDEGVAYIPDTYIVSYPELGIADYFHCVISASLGPVHKSLNTKALEKDIAELCSKHLGITATVKKHSAPLTNVLTKEEAERLEEARKGLVKVPISDYNKYQQERRRNIAIQQRNNQVLIRMKEKQKNQNT